MRSFFLTLLLALSTLGAAAQVCKPDQYDMAEWFAPTQTVSNNGTHQLSATVIYPDAAHFYWVKLAAGFPWDYKSYDAQYVYDLATENSWSNALNYKIFEKPLPWSPRCVPQSTAGSGQKLASITIPAANTWYQVHTGCSTFTRQNLGAVVNEIWGPYYDVNVGGNIPNGSQTLRLSYRYACDSTYNNCKFKETFDLQQGVGQVRWMFYKNSASGYVLANSTVLNDLQYGQQVTPEHPCW